ncbi:hypothetical protein L1987_88564 [Smallanthus sonchifolius]|nr:hypothetical protein L1987_88564 [Smallanthus sonchifolius]
MTDSGDFQCLRGPNPLLETMKEALRHRHAVVTGSSDRYEKHLGRKDRADSIAAYSVTILSQLILSSSLAKNLFDSIAAPSMLSIPFCSQRPLLGRN